MWMFQALVGVSLIGSYLSYRKHKCAYPLLIAAPSAVMIFYSYNFINGDYWAVVMYVGMLGLMISAVVNYYKMKQHNKIELHTIIACPQCGHKKEEIMPVNACQYFYECENCHARLKPKQGDCCVFCSYGTVKCPPIQAGEKCC